MNEQNKTVSFATIIYIWQNKINKDMTFNYNKF